MSEHEHNEYQDLLDAARSSSPGQIVAPVYVLPEELEDDVPDDVLTGTVVDQNSVRVSDVVLRAEPGTTSFENVKAIETAELGDLEFRLEKLGWIRVEKDETTLEMKIEDFLPDLGLLVDPADKAVELLRRTKGSPDTYLRWSFLAGFFFLTFVAFAAALSGVQLAIVLLGFVLLSILLAIMIPATIGAFEGMFPTWSIRSYPARIKFEESDGMLKTTVEVLHGDTRFHGYTFSEALPREVEKLLE